MSLRHLVEEEGDDSTRLSAALRLIRLADIHASAVPDPLPDRAAAGLRVENVHGGGWVLGRGGLEQDRLASPILIDAGGGVTLPVEGAEEEVSQFVPSDDAAVFPDLVLTPTRVLIVDNPVRTVLVAKDLGGARIDVQHQDETPLIVLLFTPPATTAPASAPASAPFSAPSSDSSAPTSAPANAPVVVARYYWDQIELAFVGPASDRLPDPPGGFFELDLELSTGLVPVGGELKPIEPAPDSPRPKTEPPPDS